MLERVWGLGQLNQCRGTANGCMNREACKLTKTVKMYVLKVSSAVKRAAFRVPDQGAVVRVDLLSLVGTRNVSLSLILRPGL